MRSIMRSAPRPARGTYRWGQTALRGAVAEESPPDHARNPGFARRLPVAGYD